MKFIIVGLGNQGKKRLKVAGPDIVATVDPFNSLAQHKDVLEIPLSAYDGAILCTPDESKLPLINYFLENKKHVMVEKPILDLTSDHLQKFAHLSELNQVACYTAYNHRFEPHLVKAREIIQSGKLGKLYNLHMFYGNGTARDVYNSAWRDQGIGVVSDLIPHLIDTLMFIFNEQDDFQFTPVVLNKFENRSYDHFVFKSDNTPLKIDLEGTLLSWKNTFRFDLLAEKGSLHIDSLCKWGPSQLIYRERILPSGRPNETITTLTNPDPTWELEYEYFKKMVELKKHNLKSDLYINQILSSIS